MISPLSKDTCAAIDLEVWDVPVEKVGHFIQQVPPPLGIGTIQLEDGNLVKGFIGEAWIAEEARKEDSTIAKNITRYNGWLAYLESMA
jgi:allophanate hydrolase